ncbi:transposase, partial [Streptomyces lavendulae]|uniref:transposase n=1 Tax=Streptomyces lavendulae TaxID=1914 RepID=UPI0033F57B01
TVFTGTSDAKVFIAFLDRLARQAGRKVHVIAGRHPVHRSKAVRTWLEENARRIELHLMPGYSPRNPTLPPPPPETTPHHPRLLPRPPRPLHHRIGNPKVPTQ